MKHIVAFAFNHRRLIVGISTILSLLSIYFILQIKIDNSIETLSVDNDPKLILLQQAEKTFGGNEFVVISFKGDDIFSPHVLSMIDAITTNIEKIQNVEDVLSLTNAEIAKDDEDGLGTSLIIPEDYRDRKDTNAIKEEVLSRQMYEKLLYSTNGDATSIIAWVVPLGSDDSARWRLVNDVKEVLNKHKDDRQFYLYGLPVFQEIIYKVMIQDQLVIPFILSVVVGCILFWIYRDLRLVFLPFIVIGMTALWSMGFFAMEGNTLDVVTFIFPVVLVIVSLCNAVHIISEYRDSILPSEDRTTVLKNVISQIGIPIMLTSLTTAVGFFSLATSSIRSIRNFGVYTGLGVIFAFGVSVALLPLVMAILPIKKGRENNKSVIHALETYLGRLAEWIVNRKTSILVVALIVIVVCFVGAIKLRPNMVILGMFKKHVAPEIIAAQHFVDVEMAGSCEFNILFKSDKKDAMLRPETLKLIERIQKRSFELYGMLQNLSIIDYLKEMNQVIHDNDPAFYTIPEDQGVIDEIMLIYSMDGKDEDLEEVISFDRDEARIRLFTYTAPDSKTTREWINQAEAILQEESRGADVSVEITSRPIVWVDMVDSLITEMMKTFSLAFFLIFCLMFILFRSWKLGVISAVVNIVPITITFGCMGWFDITLNMATAMMPSIAIGIAVDDTIHFIWRFEKEFRLHGTYHDALVQTFKTVGKPILITTMLISIGFAVMYFSRLTILTELGLLLSLTVVGALVADLFVAPVLMLIFRPFQLPSEEGSTEQSLSEKEMVTD